MPEQSGSIPFDQYAIAPLGKSVRITNRPVVIWKLTGTGTYLNAHTYANGKDSDPSIVLVDYSTFNTVASDAFTSIITKRKDLYLDDL